jgi:hypothetical protein
MDAVSATIFDGRIAPPHPHGNPPAIHLHFSLLPICCLHIM